MIAMKNPGKLKRTDGGATPDNNAGAFLASKPVLAAVVAFLGAGWLWLTGPENGSLPAALQPYAPAVMSLAGSFLAGLIIGRIARRKLKHVLIVGALLVVAISLLARLGVVGPAADQWVQSSVGWVGDNLGKVQSYIAALLPSATAAGGGLYLGFRGKRKQRQPILADK